MDIENIFAQFLWALGYRVHVFDWNKMVKDGESSRELGDDLVYVVLGGKTGYGEIDHSMTPFT